MNHHFHNTMQTRKRKENPIPIFEKKKRQKKPKDSLRWTPLPHGFGGSPATMIQKCFFKKKELIFISYPSSFWGAECEFHPPLLLPPKNQKNENTYGGATIKLIINEKLQFYLHSQILRRHLAYFSDEVLESISSRREINLKSTHIAHYSSHVLAIFFFLVYYGKLPCDYYGSGIYRAETKDDTFVVPYNEDEVQNNSSIPWRVTGQDRKDLSVVSNYFLASSGLSNQIKQMLTFL